MPRPQFTLRALLVAMLVVAAFFGGMAVQAKIEAKRRTDADTHFMEMVEEAVRNRTPQTLHRNRDFSVGGGALINDMPSNR